MWRRCSGWSGRSRANAPTSLRRRPRSNASGSSFRSCSAANLVGVPNGWMTTSYSSVLKTSMPISRGSKPRFHQRRSRCRDRGAQVRGFSCYLCVPTVRILRDRRGPRIRAKLFRNGLLTVALGRGAVGPVFLQVGTTFVEPTDGATYEPTEGATTDPYPPSPGACASATVLVRAKAVANANVVSFMVLSFAAR